MLGSVLYKVPEPFKKEAASTAVAKAVRQNDFLLSTA